MIENHDPIIKAPRVAHRKVGDATAIVTVSDRRLHTLDTLGTFIFDAVAASNGAGVPVTEIGTQIAETYDVTVERATEDARAFCTTLIERGIFIKARAPMTKPTLGHIMAKSEAAKAPLNAVVQTTAKCNYRCGHCYETHTNGEGELTLAELEDLFDQFQAMGVFNLGFTGGEFFTRRDADDILRAAVSRGFLVRVLTTGHYVDDGAPSSSRTWVFSMFT